MRRRAAAAADADEVGDGMTVTDGVAVAEADTAAVDPATRVDATAPTEASGESLDGKLTNALVRVGRIVERVEEHVLGIVAQVEC